VACVLSLSLPGAAGIAFGSGVATVAVGTATLGALVIRRRDIG
jgi:hypothetical protein